MGADDELSGMHSYEDALARVLAQVWRVETESVELDEALGCILAQDAISDMDMPPFDKSAVDGYACRNADTSGELSVLGIIPAGCFPDRAVGQGEAMKIMTGAPLPIGADCVVMKEHVEEKADGRIRVNVAAHAGKKNYCTQGEDVRTGDVVSKAGTRLTPQSLAVLASVGVAKPIVARRVRAGVFSTGTELVSPEDKPGPGQIRNSNSVQIAAQAESCGAEVRRYGIVADDESSLRETVQRALEENDLVISTGGVSVGDFDLMPEIFTSVGMTIHLRKVAIQPGKPIVFASKENKACFGLSGNPVSSFLQFTLFAKPFIEAMGGMAPGAKWVCAPLAQDLHRKHTARMQWFPVIFTESGSIAPVSFHGSAHVRALSGADGLAAYPIGVESLKEGEMLRICLL